MTRFAAAPEPAVLGLNGLQLNLVRFFDVRKKTPLHGNTVFQRNRNEKTSHRIKRIANGVRQEQDSFLLESVSANVRPKIMRRYPKVQREIPSVENSNCIGINSRQTLPRRSRQVTIARYGLPVI